MEDKVRLIIGEKDKVPQEIIDILSRMADVPGVKRPIVALPDIHFKLSYHTPTGVVVLAKDTIVPKFVNPNCGMSFIVMPFFHSDITDDRLNAIFSYIKNHVSVSTTLKPGISKDDLKEIVKNGASWAFNKCSLNLKDMENFENNGSLFLNESISAEEILLHIPESCQNIGRCSMGVLGFGNHFIEMHKAEEVINHDIAKRFNISKDQICFIIHGDSREFGRSIYDSYSKKAKKLLGLQQLYKKVHYSILSSSGMPHWAKKFVKDINYYGNRMKSLLYFKLTHNRRGNNINFPSIDPCSPEGAAYKMSTYAGLNYAYANRAYMASVIRDALRKALRKDNADIKILLDGNHDNLQEEVIDGNKYWVHRNGASRALPPEFYKKHDIFSVTGQPVLLPSSLGRPSFLCAATKGCPESYYSTCHGTGRLIDRGHARQTFKKEDVLSEIHKSGMKIFDYGEGMISEESPGAFKDVMGILKTIEQNNIATPIVRLRPLASLKGWL